MRKIISALLIAVLMLATFAARGNKPDDGAKETTASVNTVGIKLEFTVTGVNNFTFCGSSYKISISNDMDIKSI